MALGIAPAAAQQGKGYVADKPIATHYTVTGQFQITNYLATNIYTVGGSATRADDILTVTSADATGTITSKLGKSVVASGTTTCERKSYTTTPTDVYYSVVHAPPAHGVSNYGGGAAPGSTWMYCAKFPWEECGHQEGYNRLINQPGYTNAYGEWSKIT